MFRAFPQRRDDWLGITLFPFRAYPIVAFSFCFFFSLIWQTYRRGYEPDGILNFRLEVVFGCAACFAVLTLASLVFLVMRQYRKAGQSFGFAVLNIVVGMICMPNFVRA
jgi:hypothetical protein